MGDFVQETDDAARREIEDAIAELRAVVAKNLSELASETGAVLERRTEDPFYEDELGTTGRHGRVVRPEEDGSLERERWSTTGQHAIPQARFEPLIDGRSASEMYTELRREWEAGERSFEELEVTPLNVLIPEPPATVVPVFEFEPVAPAPVEAPVELRAAAETTAPEETQTPGRRSGFVQAPERAAAEPERLHPADVVRLLPIALLVLLGAVLIGLAVMLFVWTAQSQVATPEASLLVFSG